MKGVGKPAHVRRSPRLREFAYDTPGAYFVTACTYRRRPTLATVSPAGVACLTDIGRIALDIWESLPARFDGVSTDAFVVMPDHIHGIVWFGGDDDMNSWPELPRPRLTDVMSVFKSLSARNVNDELGRGGGPLWQRSFYDHVIRTERELSAAREYIVNNPIAFSLKARTLIRAHANRAEQAPPLPGNRP